MHHRGLAAPERRDVVDRRREDRPRRGVVGRVGVGGVEGVGEGGTLVADDADVGAELHRVVVGDPGEVVREVVRRRDARERARVKHGEEDEAEVDLVLRRVALLRERLARQAVAEVVDEAVADRPGVPDGDARGVRPGIGARRVGEGRDARDHVVDGVGADEKGLAVGEVEVEPGGVRVEVNGERHVEAVAGRVELRGGVRAVALGAELVGRVSRGGGGQGGERHGIEAAQTGEGRVELRGGERRDAARRVDVAQLAAAEARQRHAPDDTRLAAILAPLVAVEEEEPVLHDGAADRPAVRVADKRGALDPCAVVEEVVGCQHRRPVEPEGRAAELVTARLGDDRDLRARGAPHLRVGVCGDDAELLDGLGVEAEHGVRRRVGAVARDRADLVGLLLVDVHTVERDVGLVGARARDVAGARDARLQRQQRGDVAGFERELRDLLRDEVVAERGVLPVEENLARRGRDGDGLADGPDLKPDVHLARLGDEHAHVREDALLEAGRFGLDAVVAGLHQLEGVCPLGAGGCVARRVRLRVDERHGRADDDVALRVGDGAAHGGGALRAHPGADEQGEGHRAEQSGGAAHEGRLPFHRSLQA